MKAGRELDALIAEKVMGLHPCSDPIGRCDAAKMTPCQCWGTPDRFGVVSGGELASYSTDIAAAWLVVEKLKERSDIFPQISWLRVHDNAFQHRCEIWRNDPPSKQYGWLADVYAETIKLAICLAALKAVGVEVDA